MDDSENLSKLLGHLPLADFRSFLVDHFGLEVPELDTGAAKKAQRACLESYLSSLNQPARQKLEEVAEEIVLLSDGPGQDVIDGFRQDLFDDGARAEFNGIPNQYARAVWLCINEPALFKEALSARQADVFRQSVSCYSGYVAPVDLTVLNDPASRQAFHEAIAQQHGCQVGEVAVEIFKRMRPDAQTGDDVELYQVSVYHNRAPEIVDCVHESELVHQEVIRATATHITYEPANGHLEVLSKSTDGREELATIVAEHVLNSPITGEKIPLKQYSYQSLSEPRTFDLTGEPTVASAKVLELGSTSASSRSLIVKISTKDTDDIHVAARAVISPIFSFAGRHLTYARLSIRLQKVGKDRARTITVILRDENKCNIKTKREKDRALCDRLLAKWNLVREIGGVTSDPVYPIAA